MSKSDQIVDLNGCRDVAFAEVVERIRITHAKPYVGSSTLAWSQARTTAR